MPFPGVTKQYVHFLIYNRENLVYNKLSNITDCDFGPAILR